MTLVGIYKLPRQDHRTLNQLPKKTLHIQLVQLEQYLTYGKW